MKNNKILLLVVVASIFLMGCGGRQTKETAVDNNAMADTAEVTRLADLTEELTLNDSDEDIQVFTMKIGNDPERSHLSVSFPFTKYAFINEYERDFSQRFIDEFKSEAANFGSDATSAADFNQHFEIKHRSDELVVFLYTRSKSLGNNYDDSFIASMFDLKNGKRISATDFFESPESFEAFATDMREMAAKAVRQKLNESDDFANQQERETVWMEMLPGIDEGTAANEENYDALFFDENKEWYVIFDKYQIASGAMGSFTIKIPQSVIGKYLNRKFAALFAQSKQADEVLAPVAPAAPSRPQSSPAEQDLQAPCVALTFDDGPSVYTSRLLDILREENVKATFFVLGKSAAVQKQTLRRIAEEGHNIGNHSYDHKNFAKISLDEARRQITLTDDITQEITGSKPTYFRFPYGAFTNDKLMLVNRPIIGWNIDPLDWKYRDAEKVAAEMSKASANAIILAHDIHKTTVEAIPQVIRNLKAKGYRIVTLDELFAGKSVQNNKVYSSGK